MKTPMSEKDFTFAMARLLKQKKYRLYKLAVEKRKKWLSEHKNSQPIVNKDEANKLF